MSSEDDATASQGGEEEFSDAAAQSEVDEKEERKIPTPLPSPVSVEALAARLAVLESGSTAAAEKIKELELSLLKERDARREAEVQLMQKQLAEANSKGKEVKVEEETNWRKLEEYYDSLKRVSETLLAGQRGLLLGTIAERLTNSASPGSSLFPLTVTSFYSFGLFHVVTRFVAVVLTKSCRLLQGVKVSIRLTQYLKGSRGPTQL